jgi:hypothetical protein
MKNISAKSKQKMGYYIEPRQVEGNVEKPENH